MGSSVLYRFGPGPMKLLIESLFQDSNNFEKHSKNKSIDEKSRIAYTKTLSILWSGF